MFYENFKYDSLRYVYGRGVLFKLSSFYLFLFLVVKDLGY